VEIVGKKYLTNANYYYSVFICDKKNKKMLTNKRG